MPMPVLVSCTTVGDVFLLQNCTLAADTAKEINFPLKYSNSERSLCLGLINFLRLDMVLNNNQLAVSYKSVS